MLHNQKSAKSKSATQRIRRPESKILRMAIAGFKLPRRFHGYFLTSCWIFFFGEKLHINPIHIINNYIVNTLDN